MALLSLGIGAACGDDPDEPVELEVRPGRLELAKGRTGTAAAMSQGAPVGAAISWRSANSNIASVTEAADGTAMITAVGVGETQILATLRDGTAALQVVVGEPVIESISITPPAPSLAAGTSAALVATAILSDMTTRDVTGQVQWTTSDASKATINGAGGLRGVAKGTATVRATGAGGLQASATITVTDALLVTLQVGPTTPTLPDGTTQQMTATGIFTDGTNQNLTAMVTWTSSATTFATISAGGLVTAVDPGTSTITATLGQRSGSTTLTVTAAALRSLAITPATPSVAKGLTVSLTATGTFTDNSTQDLSDQVTWASAQTNIATMTGRVATGANVGNATITATMAGVTGTTTLAVTPAVLQSIEVTPAAAQIPLGSTRQYTATGTFSDASTQNLTTQVTWMSSDSAVIAVSNADGTRGLATGLALGTGVTISATMGTVTGQTTADVINVVLVSIAVTEATAGDLPVGRTRQLTAIGTYNNNNTEDLTTQVTWTSSDDTRATVSNADGSRGLVTAVSAGGVTITAIMGTVTGTLAVNVVPPVVETITVTPAATVMFSGDTQQMTAMARLSDNSNVDVTNTATWSSSDAAVASVSATGLVTALTMGTVTISAAQGGVTGTATVEVKVITALDVAATDVAWGTKKQLIATATFSDGTSADVTQIADWSSGNTAALPVTNAGVRGEATALSTAGATITATLRSFSDAQAIGGCKIVINEFQVRGPSSASDEFVELASTCSSVQNLAGLRVVYRAATNTNPIDGGDSGTLATLTGTIASDEYVFYVNTAVAGSYNGERGTFGSGMADSGGLAIRFTTSVIVDAVGFGSSTNLFFEGARITAPSATQSASRTPNKADTDSNTADFALTTTKTPGAAN